MATSLPNFTNIEPLHIPTQLKTILDKNNKALKELLTQEKFTFENLLIPLEAMGDELHQLWSPVAHLHAVMESDALREAYNQCLPMLTEYHTNLLQNEALFKAIQHIAESEDYANLSPAARKVIDNDLRDFRLSGVHLEPKDKTRFAELQKKLTQLSTKFGENVLDATHEFSVHITDIELLRGLPEQTLELMAGNANQKKLKGWLLTLDYPCYSSVMKYLDNRKLRHTMYEAYVTRASDQGPNAHKYDNSNIMEEILKIRREIANLLGFENYAEYSLATKMADTSSQVLSFLEQLVLKSKEAAQLEIEELTAFAKSLGFTETLEAWDLAFYTEKLRLDKYALSEETLRQYFPTDVVLQGVLNIFQRLYNITLKEITQADIWHPTVQVFEIYDHEKQLVGHVYIDLYARPHKREGAWMDDCRGRRRKSDGSFQLPIAFLTCNFSRPLNNKPALLTHDEVLTLLHEFGHCLHHLLTKVEYTSVGGINGVPWDAVEFPSQLFECWGYEREALALLTGNQLPENLYLKMRAAKNFQAALQMLRQLEFALFDFRIHLKEVDKPIVQETLDEVRKNVSVFKTPEFNRFQHTFSHIFAGGYAAGYYSYKWAEVLSSDAFEKFEENGIFDQQTGLAFLHHILEQGGVYHPMTLYKNFRGREPSVDALLRYSGLISA